MSVFFRICLDQDIVVLVIKHHIFLAACLAVRTMRLSEETTLVVEGLRRTIDAAGTEACSVRSLATFCAAITYHVTNNNTADIAP